MGKNVLAKYDDLGNPTVTVHIGNTQILNVLVDLGAAINIMTIETVRKLGLTNLRPTPTVLQLADRSTIKPEGIWMTSLSQLIHGNIWLTSWFYNPSRS